MPSSRKAPTCIYNLVVLWVRLRHPSQGCLDEMDRRERLLGIAEKLPKEPCSTHPAAQGRRARKPPRPQVDGEPAAASAA